MRRDSRLSVALHVLLHMSEMRETLTSEALGELMKTNPVVLRRTMGCLRDAGIVTSEKGHGGGWSIARDLRAVTLGDVYDALGPTTLFGIGHRQASPSCPIERAVNHRVGEALARAEAALMKHLHGVVVADVLKTARRRKAS